MKSGRADTVQAAMRALLLLVTLPISRKSIQTLLWLIRSDAHTAHAAYSHLPRVSWSQEGEDLALVEALPESGTYVDVGAHDPFRFSNTKLLYDRGWRGVNIDYTHTFVERFSRYRPEDKNFFALVGTPTTRILYRFQEEALNTLSQARAETLRADGWKLESEEEVHVTSLDNILKNADVPTQIDLLSIDAEGSDLQILQSLNWSKWKVERVLVEISLPAYLVHTSPIARFLKEHDLRLTRVWGRTCLFERSLHETQR